MPTVDTSSNSVGTKGNPSRLLEWRIFEISRRYRKLTVRHLYYVLVNKYGYPPTRRFYKRVVYHLAKIRRKNRELDGKFVDTTRPFILAPDSYPKVEVWVEKDSIRNFLEDLTTEYRVSVQVLRGFASLTMFRDAVERAASRGVRKILYVGDFDPSGLLIEEVAQKEMAVEIERIALTLEQIHKYNPPYILVNRRDSRAEDYVNKYGDRSWEIEALEPETLLKLIEGKLRENVPQRHLERAKSKERIRKAARSIIQKFTGRIEKMIRRLL